MRQRKKNLSYFNKRNKKKTTFDIKISIEHFVIKTIV